jgi:hypothetical protein
MKRSRFVLAFIALTAPWMLGADNTGCASESSTDVAPSRVHASYWLFYDADGDRTFARAQFRFGSASGTPLVLEAPASVVFDDRPMPFNALLDWHEVTMPGRVEAGSFRYIAADGARYENAVVAFSVAEITGLPSSMSRAESQQLTWTGSPVSESEVFEFVLADDDNRFRFIRVDQRNVGATDVVIPASDLSSLPEGPAVVSLRRHRDLVPSQPAPAGGKLTITYQAPNQFVLLK